MSNEGYIYLGRCMGCGLMVICPHELWAQLPEEHQCPSCRRVETFQRVANVPREYQANKETA